jgi:hypothetical protein
MSLIPQEIIEIYHTLIVKKEIIPIDKKYINHVFKTNDETFLIICCKNNVNNIYTDIILHLIDNGSIIDCKNKYGCSPLNSLFLNKSNEKLIAFFLKYDTVHNQLYFKDNIIYYDYLLAFRHDQINDTDYFGMLLNNSIYSPYIIINIMFIILCYQFTSQCDIFFVFLKKHFYILNPDFTIYDNYTNLKFLHSYNNTVITQTWDKVLYECHFMLQHNHTKLFKISLKGVINNLFFFKLYVCNINYIINEITSFLFN